MEFSFVNNHIKLKTKLLSRCERETKLNSPMIFIRFNQFHKNRNLHEECKTKQSANLNPIKYYLKDLIRNCCRYRTACIGTGEGATIRGTFI